MDDLPELPFEQVLSYLSLEDRLKARAVSRDWRNMFDRYPVKTLCYSSYPSDFILGKNRWVSEAFAQNFISSSRFATFFDTFGQTILSSLKHLRLCDLRLNEEHSMAFARTLNSFSQLEQLDIIRTKLDQQDVLKLNLNLPMLTSLHLERAYGIEKLTLEAPRLREVKILDCYIFGLTSVRLEIVHGESVERLLVDWLEDTDVKNLKNLKALYIGGDCLIGDIEPTLLSSQQQLKEIHMKSSGDVSKMFEQKRRYGRADLKIFLGGLLLNGPDDPAINVFPFSRDLSRGWLVCLAENRSRLADEIPFYREIEYSHIEGVASGLEVDLLKRFIHLTGVTVYNPVQDIQRFLDLLENCENLSKLSFSCDQPQDLFDRLPEHCAAQLLTIRHAPSDLDFLFRLKHLIHLYVLGQIENETVRRAFEQLPVLSLFHFGFNHKWASIEINHSKQFMAWVSGHEKTVFDLNAAIEFIFGKNPS